MLSPRVSRDVTGESRFTGLMTARCQDCIVNWIGSCEDQNKPAMCPMCDKGPVAMSDLRSVQRRRKRINPITGAFADSTKKMTADGADDSGAVTLEKVDLVSSTKLRALVRRLEMLRAEDPGLKALVFSQFTSFLGQSPTLQRRRLISGRVHRLIAQISSRPHWTKRAFAGCKSVGLLAKPSGVTSC